MLTPPTLSTVRDMPQNSREAKGGALTLTHNTLHWLSSGLVSFARGLNDAPKIVAPAATALLMAGDQPSAAQALFPLVALAMGLGSFWGGRRVTKSLAEKVTEMDSVGGLAANLTTAFLVTIAATMGLPVSTTHVSSGAIIGVGLTTNKKQVQWRTLKNFRLAWVVTLPAAGVLATLGLWGLALIL